ncbi:hypothetical protein NIES2119_16240 [[Phormidium ambiguum] IAM M-71]|uniref:DUF4132 domain-containing protein n=1 Tax=[Phormidium ambiguum] IAM M-71 TaxID=454136 RepID=A0A1U7IHP8_9CYAN|nr:DUF4132 domain-containing protein [Phormidium ambiguum]OKH36579.1 hypothetical protein NIES2119_16240 [Phormidium ambiguum IAM M-71]
MDRDRPKSNAIALSEESVQLILEDFGRYQEPLPQAILQYLVEGGDDAILQQLQERYMPMIDERSAAFRGWDPSPSPALRYQMLHTLTTQDIEFYYRLARIYAVEAENLRWLSIGWLGLFFMFLGNNRFFFSLEQPPTPPPVITAHLIESLLVRFGDRTDTLARLVFLAELRQANSGNPVRLAWIGASLPEFSAYSLKHESVIREALDYAAVEARIHALNMLAVCQMSPIPFASLLVDRATAKSKLERAAAFIVIQREARAMVPFVQAKAQTGNATERAHAARLLMDLIGIEARLFLEERLEIEQTATVKDAIEQVLFYIAILSEPEPEILLSPLPIVVLEAPLPASVREEIERVLNQCYELAQGKYEEQQGHLYPSIPQPQPPSPEFVDRVFECLQFGTAAECFALQPIYHYLINSQVHPQFRQLLEIPELDLIHVTRLLLLMQRIPTQSQTLVPTPTIPQCLHWGESEIITNNVLQPWCQRRQPNGSLRYLVSGFEALGISGDTIAWKMLTLEESPFWSWGEQAIWEYFAERLSILDVLFGLGSLTQIYYSHEQTARRQLFQILELCPQLPARFIPQLWDIALNGNQREMCLAQRCLDKRPGTQERLHQLVNHSERSIQIIAIQWLIDRLDRTAIPQFQEALRRQPTGTVRDLLLRGLEKLGISIDRFVDRSQLHQESQVGLRKGMPQALSWFPFGALPKVRWHDREEPVPIQILIWFIVQSYQQKNPEPSPVLRQYAKLWKKEDCQRFGQFVLESWINQDTQVASAVKEKGILAVAGACGGAAMVPAIDRYLKTYFGNRLAQCLALLQMLTWSDDFAAIQLLLSVANRFRTAKIQEAAQQCVQQLAQRQGWTLAELGDRTIPWCGLAEDGTLLLDYGSRQFTAHLNAECQLVLSDDSGKVLKSLPTARKDDDAELVKVAKQQWTATKKQLELVRSQQQTRLYEALCTQRSWTFSDWEIFLHQNPIVGRWCQRLIWAVFIDNSVHPVQTFRPQENGSLIDAENNVVTVSPTACVRLAQATLLSDELTQSWQKHLINSQITPLFDNWTAVYSLPKVNQEMTEITDFVGLSLSRHQLRQRAMQQGYLPKTAEFEHGWTVDYRKHFESMNLEAVIDFSGDSPVSEEDFEVQLGEVYFWQKRKVPLAEVPPVLLSIVWSEILAIVKSVIGVEKVS